MDGTTIQLKVFRYFKREKFDIMALTDSSIVLFQTSFNCEIRRSSFHKLFEENPNHNSVNHYKHNMNNTQPFSKATLHFKLL